MCVGWWLVLPGNEGLRAICQKGFFSLSLVQVQALHKHPPRVEHTAHTTTQYFTMERYLEMQPLQNTGQFTILREREKMVIAWRGRL